MQGVFRAPRASSVVTECHAQERRSCAPPEASTVSQSCRSMASVLLNGKRIAGWQVCVLIVRPGTGVLITSR